MNRTEMLQRLRNGEDPLEVSIQKWQDIVDGKGEDEESYNCALCYSNPGLECSNCLIKMKTGKPDCANTPYTEYQDKLTNPSRWAKKELEFLKSLRKTP